MDLQDKLERTLFHSRWILAPMYVGLVLGLGLLVIMFGKEFWHTVSHFAGFKAQELTVAVLELVDIVLVGNLLLLVIFSGYENFVSKIDAAEGHQDRPSWMGTIDYSGLKQKIIGSVVAISSIELLKLFMKVNDADDELTRQETQWKTIWMIALHVTFIFSGLIFAITERIGHNSHAPPAVEAGEKKAARH